MVQIHAAQKTSSQWMSCVSSVSTGLSSMNAATAARQGQLTADGLHVGSGIDVEHLAQPAKGHGAVVLPPEVCRGVRRRLCAAIPREGGLQLHQRKHDSVQSAQASLWHTRSSSLMRLHRSAPKPAEGAFQGGAKLCNKIYTYRQADPYVSTHA